MQSNGVRIIVDTTLYQLGKTSAHWHQSVLKNQTMMRNQNADLLVVPGGEVYRDNLTEWQSETLL